MLRIGLLGAGFMGSTHVEAISHCKNGQVTAIADTNVQAAYRLANPIHAKVYDSAESLMDDPDVDIIDVCLPTYLHEKWVRMASERGKHLFCEKPIALNLSEIDRMISAVTKSGVIAMVGQVVRFWPEYLKIAELVKSGSFGEIFAVNASRRASYPNWGDWFKNPTLSGGALLDLHIHDVDYIYSLFGKPRQVFAIGKKTQNDAWNHVITTLIYDTINATAEASYLMPNNYPFQVSFRLYSSDGSLEYAYRGGQVDERTQAQTNLTVYRSNRPPENPDIPKQDGYEAEIEYFLACVLDNRQPEIATLLQAREVLTIMFAAKKSLDTGKIITV